MDKQEIMSTARSIGTLDISTRNHQDCCVLFEPHSVATRTSPAEAADAEADLEIDALAGKALAGRETKSFELEGLGHETGTSGASCRKVLLHRPS
jgi:thiamine biosynthesis protein ThiI